MELKDRMPHLNRKIEAYKQKARLDSNTIISPQDIDKIMSLLYL